MLRKVYQATNDSLLSPPAQARVHASSESNCMKEKKMPVSSNLVIIKKHLAKTTFFQRKSY